MIDADRNTRIYANGGWLTIEDRMGDITIKISHIDAIKFKVLKNDNKRNEAEIIFTKGSENIAMLKYQNILTARSTHKYLLKLVEATRQKEGTTDE